MKDQSRKIKPVAKRVSDNSSSDQVYDRRFHPPSISKSTLDSTATPYPIANTVLLMPNRVAPIPTSNGYNNLYSSYSDEDPVFEEMIDSKSLKAINTYIVVHQPLTLASTPTKVTKKQCNIIVRTRLATIKRA